MLLNGRERCSMCRRSILLILAYVCVELSMDVSGKVYPTVQWSPRNPLFKDQPFLINVLPMSSLIIECPHRAMALTSRNKAVPKEELYENFWIVGIKSFNSCSVNNSIAENKILLRCDKPTTLNFIELQFKQFSASGDDPVYVPGKTYYFIATSDGYVNSLDSTNGGHCQSANMRMKIYVCNDSQDPRCSETPPTTSPPSTKKLQAMSTRKTPEHVSTAGPVLLSSPLQNSTSQTPRQPVEGIDGPNAGALTEKKKEGNSLSTLELVLICLTVVLIIVLTGVIFYYERFRGKSKEKPQPV